MTLLSRISGGRSPHTKCTLLAAPDPVTPTSHIGSHDGCVWPATPACAGAMTSAHLADDVTPFARSSASEQEVAMVDGLLLPDAQPVGPTSTRPIPARERGRLRGAPDDRHGLAIDTSFGSALGLELDRERVRRGNPVWTPLSPRCSEGWHRVARPAYRPLAGQHSRARARPWGRPGAGTRGRAALPEPRSRSRMNRVHERRARMTHLNRTRRTGTPPPRADVRARPNCVTPRFRTGPRLGGAHARPRACLDGMRGRTGRSAVTPLAFLVGVSHLEVTMAPMRDGGAALQNRRLVVERLSR